MDNTLQRRKAERLVEIKAEGWQALGSLLFDEAADIW